MFNFATTYPIFSSSTTLSSATPAHYTFTHTSTALLCAMITRRCS